MRVLVTGGAGFVGANLTAALLEPPTVVFRMPRIYGRRSRKAA
jgi:uncharacterized protein YbjT (DUF2867 family)